MNRRCQYPRCEGDAATELIVKRVFADAWLRRVYVCTRHDHDSMLLRVYDRAEDCASQRSKDAER